MFQLAPQRLTVDEFITRYGDDERYEIVDGELIDLEPTGLNEQVAAFISRKLNVAIDRQSLPYFIPHRCLIRLLGTETAFRPDVMVVRQNQLVNEPLWQQEPVITLGTSIALIVEVVSRRPSLP